MKNKKLRSIMLSLSISSSITAIIAIIMGIFNIPVTVILPTSAPIWMGFISLSVMMNEK